jgi:hypothetical protein
MVDTTSHLVNVRDKAAFLRRLMIELASNAQISLEGDLSGCRFDDGIVVTREETAILKRNTLSPVQDFVVLRLAPETVQTILKQVTAVGLNRAIIHVQIERNGVLELAAYDNFDGECVMTGPYVSPALLDELKNVKVLREFRETSSRR